MALQSTNQWFALESTINLNFRQPLKKKIPKNVAPYIFTIDFCDFSVRNKPVRHTIQVKKRRAEGPGVHEWFLGPSGIFFGFLHVCNKPVSGVISG